jgi:MOSC domain-containing protein YiiM
LYTLPIGTQLKIGEATFEITQIGKPFERNPLEHTPREIIMHQEGVFAVVLSSGSIEAGDELYVIGTP